MFINHPYSTIGTAKFSLIRVMDSESTEPGTADRVLDIVKLAKMVSKLVKIHHHYRETTKKADSGTSNVIIMDGQSTITYKR